MRNRKRMFSFLGVVLCAAGGKFRREGDYTQGKNLDESGFPAAARVYLTDEKGESYSSCRSIAVITIGT